MTAYRGFSAKRVLVTGGAGFLGAHLCRRLLQQGHEVICLDNFFTGNKNNLMDMIGQSAFEIIRHDVSLPIFLEVDEIYNMACPASPVHYQYNPTQTIKTSIQGAINMLGLAKRVKARILQASTSEVYGDPLEHPQTESYWGHVNPIGPRACYDEGKRCAETLFMDYHRQFGVDGRIARIFNCYGPGMHPNDGRVVSNFIMQALRGEALTLYGDGEQTRSFCYVDDLISGLISLMETDDLPMQPVNIGNPHEFSIRTLAKKIQAIIGTSQPCEFLPLPGDDPRQRQPDISRIQALTGWKPTTSLDQGLPATIAWFRDFV